MPTRWPAPSGLRTGASCRSTRPWREGSRRRCARNETTTWPAEITSRELEVLRLVAAGKPNKEIAAELDIASARHGRMCRGFSASWA